MAVTTEEKPAGLALEIDLKYTQQMIVIAGRSILFLNGTGPENEFFNPGGVLEIHPRVNPVSFPIEDGGRNLATELDKLMSNKGNYLSRDPDFLKSLEPFNEGLRHGLAELKETSFSLMYIQPLIIELEKLRVQAQDVNSTADVTTFTKLASKVIEDAFKVKLLEINLFIQMCKWADLDTTYYEATRQETETIMREAGYDIPVWEEHIASSQEADLDSLVNQILSGFSNSPTQSQTQKSTALTTEQQSARIAMASIFNHRLGNLPGMVAEYQSYFDPHSFDLPFEDDRSRLIMSTEAKIHFLKVLQYIIENNEHMDFYHLVEWGQLRTKKIT
jgi:hypothetical protein